MPGFSLKTVNYPSDASTTRLATMPGIVENTQRQQFLRLSPGRKGVFETAEMMAACVRGEVGPDFAGYYSPEIAAILRQIEASYFGQSLIDAIFLYAQNCIKYVEHPFDLQIVQDAPTTIRENEADCVSLSVLIATCLASQNWPVWFVLQDPLGAEYSHVYCETLRNGKIIALDAVSKEPMGWRQQLTESGFETTWLIF